MPSEVLAIEKDLQRHKLVVPPHRLHEPRLAFSRGAIAQLTRDALVVYDSSDFHELLHEPLSDPRVVLTLADGALIALGSRQLLHWQPGWKRTKSLALPSLLPGMEVYADAQQGDRFWVFDGLGSALRGAPTLHGFRLAAAGEIRALPEQTIELTSPRGGVFGVTREGVWLYLTPGHQERLAPSGLRLPGASFSEQGLPAWALPARRLDQALWIDEAGVVTRVLTGSTFRRLGEPVTLPGRPYAVAVGDDGQLLASVLITGPGPRFELELRDAELQPLARVPLPSDAPTGSEDWLKPVTENQQLEVAPHGGLVAVGGPLRLAIFSAAGQQLFSKTSQ